MMPRRVFTAIDLPPAIRAALACQMAQLPCDGARVSRIVQANLHVTLHFLGDVSDEQLPVIFEAVGTVTRVVCAFRVEVSGVEVIPPTGRRLRMVWANIADPTGQLAELHRRLGDELVEVGFTPEDRPYRPHVTLMRVKSARDPDILRRATASLAEQGFGECLASAVTVYESTLAPEGPIYTSLGHCRFQGWR